MKRMRICAISTVAVMGASLMMSGAAMAQEDTIAIPYEQEAAWDEIAMTNDDTVYTGLNIHSTADKDSPVLGYLYQGAAAWVIEKGETWTEIYSGGLTGFVMNDYLVYGEEAIGLAQNYGIEGVTTTWDDVKLYASDDGAADVLDSLSTGTSFILTEDGGHWIQVQNGADATAYVSSEDVSRVLLLDTAVPVEGDVRETSPADYSDTSYTETSYAEETYTDTSYTEETYTDTADYSEAAYTDTADYSETAYNDTADYNEEAYTDTADYSDTYTDTSAGTVYTEEAEDTASTESSAQSLPYGIGYYDEYTGTYYDYYGNPVYTGTAQIGYYDEYTGTYYDVYGNPMFTISSGESSSETAVTEEQAAAETEAAVPETEAASTSTAASSDDTSLLAALIYCEAGNQSYEGMVAVGAVVMNRVASSSFPNTISDVIYQSGQFTPAYSGALSSALASGVPSTCYEAAAAALNGENPVGSALYFNTGSGKGVKIGAHQFY